MKGAWVQETLIKAEVTENQDYNDEVLERAFQEMRAFREKYKIFVLIF